MNLKIVISIFLTIFSLSVHSVEEKNNLLPVPPSNKKELSEFGRESQQVVPSSVVPKSYIQIGEVNRLDQLFKFSPWYKSPMLWKSVFGLLLLIYLVRRYLNKKKV
jgi:hypothetical protein